MYYGTNFHPDLVFVFVFFTVRSRAHEKHIKHLKKNTYSKHFHIDSLFNDNKLHNLTSAHARSTANFSIVTALSLYSMDCDFPAFILASEDTRSWWTLRRSLRSRATPLPIHVLQTWQWFEILESDIHISSRDLQTLFLFSHRDQKPSVLT